MSRLRDLGRYWESYQPNRFRTYRIAREWMEAGVAPEDATAWADLGYLPQEAAPLIADGVTAATAGELERHAEETAGGSEALREQRIQQMVDAGELLDPARVIRVQDPNDPTREIIAVRDKPGE
ncbi:hypothetical protein E1091_04200 [Micromonospora fluostatini]|uniref:Uncharacterized protein n=1 Tax=Micromonospora fluostatini TaxID=1629071 RepID=A0ABY2DKU4_9ACTN|nr:hypothetical protein E1091_04200 [Micromonospora fluostatini]